MKRLIQLPKAHARAALGLTVVVYVALRLAAYWSVFGKTPAVYPDTIVYEQISHMAPWTLDFWAGHALKTAGVPFFWKLLPGSTADAAPIAQWLVSCASWLVLASVVGSFLRSPWLRIGGFALVLAFSLSPLVLQWDGALLTESLAISLTALLLAALLALVRTSTRRNLVLVLAATLCCVLVRDQSTVFALLVLVPVAVFLAARGRRGIALSLAFGLLVIAAGSYWASNRRGVEGLIGENVAMRILPSPAATRYFVARGLPLRADLQTLILNNRFPPSHFYEVPQLAPFRAWAASRGSSTYLSYLLSHRGVSIGEPLRNLDMIVSPSRALPLGLDYFRPAGFTDALPRFVESILYPTRGWMVVIWMVITGLMSLTLAVLNAARRFWLVPGLVLASTLPNALFIWNADALGRDRHSLLIGIFGLFSMWTLLLFAVDAYLLARTGQQ